jgi:hypothetical protein
MSKVDRLLRQYGFQIQGSSDPTWPFYYNGHDVNGQHVNGFAQANYTAIQWQGSAVFQDSNGQALTGPWALWTGLGDPLPHQIAGDQPHLSQLRSLQLGDENFWVTDSAVRNQTISYFQTATANPAYNNTIIYANNFIGQLQLNEPSVTQFIQQAHPDMLTFDVYPFNTGNANVRDDSSILNTPFDSWYTEMRFYRNVTMKNGIAWGAYRQAYASAGDGTRTPSASEFGVQTYTAMAFNAKMLIDFKYTGSSTAFYIPNDDTTGYKAWRQEATTDFYNTVASVNKKAGYFGRTLVGLGPLYTNQDTSFAAGTPDILFLRGQQLTGNPSSPTTPNVLPNGFVPATVNGGLNSSWTFGANDPWMSGFGQANIGGKIGAYTNTSGKLAYVTGDALVSWFKPTEMTQAEAVASGDIYYMIVNAFSTPTGEPGDCLQNIHLDFSSWPLAPGETIPSIQYIDPNTGKIVTLYEDQTGMTVTNATIMPAGTVLLTNTAGKPNNPAGTKLRLNVYLNGGDAFIFKFNSGSTFFVNSSSVPEPGAVGVIGMGGALLLWRRRR